MALFATDTDGMSVPPTLGLIGLDSNSAIFNQCDKVWGFQQRKRWWAPAPESQWCDSWGISPTKDNSRSTAGKQCILPHPNLDFYRE